MAEITDETAPGSTRAQFPIRGYLFLCPKCETDAERIRLGVGTPKADGTPQDRYQCAETDCEKEFEDDAWFKVPTSQASIGDEFRH